jgi:DNA-binding PadR family transcriptional regulator
VTNAALTKTYATARNLPRTGSDDLLLTISRDRVYIVDMAELLGTFEQVVLLAVLRLGDEAYGRSILREAQTAMEQRRTVSAGAVYATLDRVETKGLLASHLAEGGPGRGGRARRYYQLTPQGVSALREARRILEKMWRTRRWPSEVPA